MVYTLLFSSPKCGLFHNSNIFSSCIIHILYTELKKKFRYQKVNVSVYMKETLPATFSLLRVNS